MGTWGDTMWDTVTAALITAYDERGVPTYGAQSSVKCRYEPDAVAIRNGEGEVIRYADLLITETSLDTTDTVRGGWAEAGVWPPGANTANANEALKPTRVTRTTDLDGADALLEVML